MSQEEIDDIVELYKAEKLDALKELGVIDRARCYSAEHQISRIQKAIEKEEDPAEKYKAYENMVKLMQDIKQTVGIYLADVEEVEPEETAKVNELAMKGLSYLDDMLE